MTQLLPPKKEVALALLERSNVDIYLDPRARGVVVPPQFRKEPRLILKIGLNMPVPIPDLRVDEESMSCTLSFNRSPFYCVVPWPSVFAMVGDDGRGMVWPDDVPHELSVKVAEDHPSQPPKAGSPLAMAPSPHAPTASSAAAGKGKRAARIVETVPDNSGTGNGPGKKRSAKKKDGGRPVLMALPSPPPSEPRLLESARDKKHERRADDHGAKADSKADSKRGELRVAPELTAAPSSSKDLSASKRDAPDSKRSAPASAASGSSAAVAPPAPRAPTADVPTADLRDDDVAPVSPVPPAAVGPSGRPKRELPPYLRVVK
jgi:stringent starvation protein B